VIYGISCWSAGLACYLLLCAIFRTCYLLSVCKNNCLTYVLPDHDDRILFTERLLQWEIRRAR